MRPDGVSLKRVLPLSMPRWRPRIDTFGAPLLIVSCSAEVKFFSNSVRSGEVGIPRILKILSGEGCSIGNGVTNGEWYEG
jgi:hypothetical protein